MQFPEKLTSQTSGNAEKPNFGSDFGPVGPNLGPKYFLWILPLIVARHVSNYHPMQFTRKLMHQT